MTNLNLVRAHLFTICAWLFSSLLLAQQHSIPDTLPEALVWADRTRLLGELELLEAISDEQRARTPALFLSDVLQWNSHWQVLSYGPGMVSTLAHRGNNSEQVRIYWKGIPLNHPALGMVDLSVVPASLFGQVSVMNTGSSAQLGNGALGGSVILNSGLPKPGISAELQYSMGSFGFQQAMASVSVSEGRWHSSTKLLRMQSDNDYTYQPLFGDPKPLPNANYLQHHFMQELRFDINASTYLEAALWLSEKETNIPPTVNANPRTRASLEDNNAIGSMSFNHMVSKTGGILVQYGYLHADQYYRSEFPDINSYNPARTHFAEHHHFGKWKSVQFKLGQQFTYSEGPGPNLLEGNWQRFYALFGQLSLDISSRLSSQLNLRQEWVNGFDPPLSFGWLSEYRLNDEQTLWTRVSRNYRVPTLNQLYWQPTGNPDLLPEDNLLGELGWRLCLRSKHQLGVTVYGSETNNYIQWRPGLGGLWSAQNVREVRAIGVETHWDGEWELAQQQSIGLNVRISGGRAYSIGNDDPHRGNQLIYQPVYRSANTIFYRYKKWELSLRSRFTSEMFSLPDHHPSMRLPQVWLFSGGIQRQIDLKHLRMRIQCFVENMGNAQYELQLGRPMPGTNWLMAVHFYF